MANVPDPKPKKTPLPIPGLKPPVYEFRHTVEMDPKEVEEFDRFIRELRNRSRGLDKID